jgi:PAS domain S-box-containing protein
MNIDIPPRDLLDRLNVGLSVVTYHPGDMARCEWVYANETRARMVGISREELMSSLPYRRITRETKAFTDTINEQIAAHGEFTVESTLVHKSHKVIPVLLHMSVIRREGRDLFLAEYYDITRFKETENELNLAQDRARNIMKLISEEKQQIADNIQSNLGLVAMPLIDQLRIDASPVQRKILNMLENRVKHVTQRLGIVTGADLPGSNLSRRQILISEMIRDGMTSKDIGLALGCSPSTINNHRDAIRKKLGLSGKRINLQAYLNRASRGAGTRDPDGEEGTLGRLF